LRPVVTGGGTGYWHADGMLDLAPDVQVPSRLLWWVGGAAAPQRGLRRQAAIRHRSLWSSTSLDVDTSVQSVFVKGIARYWGYVALAILLTAWWTTKVGPAVLSVLSLLVTFYFLFQAPIWCGAVNRDGTLCRRNAAGLLLGCSLRQHKWQKLQMTVVPHAWRRLNAGLWSNPTTGLATVATVLGIVSTAAAALKPLFG
jgi:hypothetical protein